MSSLGLKKFILFFGDLVVFYLVLFLTLTIRYQTLPQKDLITNHLGPFTLIFAIWLLFFYIANLYDIRSAVNSGVFIKRILATITFCGIFAVLGFYALSVDITPKTNLAIYMGLFLFVLPLWRQFYNWSIASQLPRLRLGFVGSAPEIDELTKEFSSNQHLGYKVVMYLTDTAENISNLKQLVAEKHINIMVISTDLHESADLRNALFSCLPLGVNFVNLPAFYENITGRVPINVINQTWFLENLNEAARERFETLKRQFDIIFSLVFFIITLPLWPFVAVVTKLSSKGPIFFKQIRSGKNGKEFTMFKFRTMLEKDNSRAITTIGDSRITKIGGFLRKTRIDELPQLLNILKGEMSFIGPRPERPEIVSELETKVPFYRERLLIKPGVTGWDQVSGEYHSASTEDTIKKLQYDLYYIKNRSPYLDLSILLKTIYTILSRGGI